MEEGTCPHPPMLHSWRRQCILILSINYNRKYNLLTAENSWQRSMRVAVGRQRTSNGGQIWRRQRRCLASNIWQTGSRPKTRWCWRQAWEAWQAFLSGHRPDCQDVPGYETTGVRFTDPEVKFVQSAKQKRNSWGNMIINNVFKIKIFRKVFRISLWLWNSRGKGNIGRGS